jgi:hypothetical protein
MPMGNIATMTIAEAWAGAQMTALRELHKRAGYRENKVCNHCVNGEATT